MKIRTGFVSNSSSCSFTLLTNSLTKDQIYQIKNYITVAPCYGLDINPNSNYVWHIEELENALKISIDMDDFNMLDYIQNYLKIDTLGLIKQYWHSNG